MIRNRPGTCVQHRPIPGPNPVFKDIAIRCLFSFARIAGHAGRRCPIPQSRDAVCRLGIPSLTVVRCLKAEAMSNCEPRRRQGSVRRRAIEFADDTSARPMRTVFAHECHNADDESRSVYGLMPSQSPLNRLLAARQSHPSLPTPSKCPRTLSHSGIVRERT